MSNAQILWRAARLPLLWVVFIFFVFGTWKLLGLPPRPELIEIIKGYFNTYGLWVVFFSSILEAMLVVGWYFPGSIVIFLSITLASSVEDAIIRAAIVTIGVCIGYAINFFLGKYGWYRLLLKFGIRKELEDAQENLAHYGPKAILGSYWQPGLGALVATAAGILQFDTYRFLWWSLISATLWSIFWGTVAYTFGEGAIDVLLNPLVIVGVLVVWAIGRFVNRLRLNRHKSALKEPPDLIP